MAGQRRQPPGVRSNSRTGTVARAVILGTPRNRSSAVVHIGGGSSSSISVPGGRHRRSFAAWLPSHPRGVDLHPAAVVIGPGHPSPRRGVILSAGASAASIHPSIRHRCGVPVLPSPTITGKQRGRWNIPPSGRGINRRHNLTHPLLSALGHPSLRPFDLWARGFLGISSRRASL